jgi:hypothetical protein
MMEKFLFAKGQVVGQAGEERRNTRGATELQPRNDEE